MKKIYPAARLLLAVVLLVWTGPVALAQSPAWQTAMMVGGNYSEITGTVANNRDEVYITGALIGTASFGNTVLTNPLYSYSFFVAKWSNSANSFVWAQQVSMGGAGYTVSLTVDGPNLFLAGQYRGRCTFGNYVLPQRSGNSIYVSKLVDNGTSSNFTWAESAPSSGNNIVTGVAANGANIYLVGSHNGTITFGSNVVSAASGVYSLFMAKLTDNGTGGTFAWSLAGNGAWRTNAATVAVNGSSVYVTGEFDNDIHFGNIGLVNTNGSADMFVAKFTDAGASVACDWAQQTGGPSGSATSTAMVVRGTNIYVTGWSTGVTSFGTATLSRGGSFITKLADAGTAGAFVWVEQYQASQAMYTTRSGGLLAVSGTSLYVSGSFTAATFGSTTLPTNANGDIYLAKFVDSGVSGSFAWAQRGGGADADYPVAMTVTNTGTVYVAGSVSPPASFGSQNLSNSSWGGCVVSLNDSGNLATNTLASKELTMFPNPAHGRATVQLPASTGPATLTVLDALGRPVRTQTATGLQAELDLTGLAPGLYAVRVRAGGATATRRLLVE